jgi:hypothetical protein
LGFSRRFPHSAVLQVGFSAELSLTSCCKPGAMSMMACNFVSARSTVMLLMSLAFFGKGFGALGWTVISDTSPKELVGVNGGLFNLIGNLAGSMGVSLGL